MATGWYQEGTTWYYLDQQMAMKTGWQTTWEQMVLSPDSSGAVTTDCIRKFDLVLSTCNQWEISKAKLVQRQWQMVLCL